MESLETIERFDTILKDSLSSFLRQIEERLDRQQHFIEASFHDWSGSPEFHARDESIIRSGEAPDIPESPAFRPGNELITVAQTYLAFQPTIQEVEAPEATESETPTGMSEPHSRDDRKLRWTTHARGSAYTKPNRQNSYELAKEEESKTSMIAAHSQASSPSVAGDVMFNTDFHQNRHPAFRSLARMVSTWQFESFFATLIFGHAILLGLQIEWECQNLTSELPTELAMIHITFTSIFLLEIILRVTAFGAREYFTGQSYAWNLIDVFLVLVAVIEILADALTEDSFASGSFRILRILRLARSARGLRIIRLLRFIRPLRLLVFSIAVTLKSLVWSIILLFIIIYLFSILFADANLAHFTSGGHTPPEVLTDQDLQAHFGSVQTSMHTLFRAISGGLEWRHAANSLNGSIGWGWSSLFTCYIAFCCFAVLNVMTGVFCHSAITSAEQDHEIMVQSMVNEQERIRAAFADLFRQMDKDGSGTITIKEFEKGFQVETTSALFEALGLKAEDAWTLFRSLDKDGDHRVGESEFVEGCIHIRGPARQVDLRRQAQRTRTQLDGLEGACFEFLVLLKEMAKTMDIDPSEVLGEIQSAQLSGGHDSD